MIKGFQSTAILLIGICSIYMLVVAVTNAAEYIAPQQTAIVSLTQVGQNTINVNLSENTSPLNAVEVELFFDPTHFVVNDLTISPVLCEERFVITKIIDNTAGVVFYQCGTITPFSGTSTTLATLYITPVQSGNTQLTFGDKTNTLAHDGYGSNVTKDRLPAELTL